MEGLLHKRRGKDILAKKKYEHVAALCIIMNVMKNVEPMIVTQYFQDFGNSEISGVMNTKSLGM